MTSATSHHGSAARPNASRIASSVELLVAGDLRQVEGVHRDARGHGIDPYPVRARLDRGASGWARWTPGLGRRVVRLPGLSTQPTTNTLLMIAPLRRGSTCRSADRGRRSAVQRHVQHPVPLLVVISASGVVPPRPALFTATSISTVRGDDGVEQPLDVGLHGHVTRDGQRRLPGDHGQLLGGLGQRR